MPVAMCIGPFSLTSKLMADPITPVCLAGAGVSGDEESEVALLEACLEISVACVPGQIERLAAAGARAVFVAEPAANKIFFSPRQVADGSDDFERFVLRPNRCVAGRLADHNIDLLFHGCGELTDEMLDGFCTLRPGVLGLGSSRTLWEDAAQRITAGAL